MIPDTTILNAWAAGWSACMVAMLWQSALLAGAVGLVILLLRRASPAVRYWLWQIVAVKLLLMPLWSVSLALDWLPTTAGQNRPTQNAPPVAETPVAEGPVPDGQDILPTSPSAASATSVPSAGPLASELSAPHVPSQPVPVRQPLSWTAWLMIAWAALVVGQIALLLWQVTRLARLLKHASPAGAALQSLVSDCAARIKLARTPRVLTVDRECSPFVCGIWRPVIVLPKSLESVLPDGLLAPVIVHELAHVKRWDLLWNWIPQITRMLYFFNPIAHWVAFRVRLEGELACDGWAMAATGQAAGDYADLLVRIVGRLSEPAMLRSGSAASAGLGGHGTAHDTAHGNEQR